MTVVWKKLTQHVMEIVWNQDNSLNEKIDRFCDLDTIGIKENKTSVYDRFISNIKFSFHAV